MNKLEQAAQNLLDYFDIDDCGILFNSRMEALREALAEQAAVKESLTAQDPVAWAYEYGTDRGDAVNEIRWYQNLTALDKPKPVEGGLIRNVRPLYAAPVRTKDLADDEICRMWNDWHDVVGAGEFALIARAVIAADRELNK